MIKLATEKGNESTLETVSLDFSMTFHETRELITVTRNRPLPNEVRMYKGKKMGADAKSTGW